MLSMHAAAHPLGTCRQVWSPLSRRPCTRSKAVASGRPQHRTRAQAPSNAGTASPPPTPSASVPAVNLEEYVALKASLQRQTLVSGLALAGYLTLALDPQGGALALAGTAASCAYLRALLADVDAIAPGSRAARAVQLPARSGPLRTLAALRVALQPRLLAFVVLAAALGTLPGLSDLDGLHQACALAGCLSHKAALFGQVYAATKPRALTQEELLRPPPPRILPLEDDRA
uniref:Uncharacterized protein n=1 Tax=Auxenochlorella protothecoides TaxID=3075 RepID=A0A1D2AAB5_AUXPR